MKIRIFLAIAGVVALTQLAASLLSPAHAAAGVQVCDAGSPPRCAPFAFANINSATTTVVKVGGGWFHQLCINKTVASATVTMYDNTAGSGTLIGVITLPATLVAEGPLCAPYDVAFSTGLTLVTVGAQDLTVSFK